MCLPSSRNDPCSDLHLHHVFSLLSGPPPSPTIPTYHNPNSNTDVTQEHIKTKTRVSRGPCRSYASERNVGGISLRHLPGSVTCNLFSDITNFTEIEEYESLHNVIHRLLDRFHNS